MSGPAHTLRSEDEQISAALARLSKPLQPIETGLAPGGELRAPLRAVMFDIYGTLLISASGDIAAADDNPAADTAPVPSPVPSTDPAVAALLNELGIDISPTDLYDQFITAVQAGHARKKKEGVDHPEVAVDEIWATILKLETPRAARPFALTFETAVNPVYPMPHAVDLLRRIRETGLTAGIISNAQFYTARILEYFMGSLPEASWAHPDLIFYSCCFGYAKPSLYLFKKAAAALNRLKISPGDTLYVGNDMLKDIAPARACGFQTALFAGDARSLRLRKDDHRVSDIQPDLTITDLAQLEPYLPVK